MFPDVYKKRCIVLKLVKARSETPHSRKARECFRSIRKASLIPRTIFRSISTTLVTVPTSWTYEMVEADDGWCSDQNDRRSVFGVLRVTVRKRR
jgi:hypothetical protein